MSKLLFDTYPLVIDPQLAVRVGLNEAIILQQIHYWIQINAKANRNHRDGHFWTYNSYEGWQEQFPFWSLRTIKRLFTSLEKRGLIITANYNRLKLDRTKWYRINYKALQSLVNSPLCQNGTMESDNTTPPIPETIFTETNKINNHNGAFRDFCEIHERPSQVYNTRNKEASIVIKMYMEKYKETFGEKHPMLKAEQVERVSEVISCFMSEQSMDLDGMEQMIDRHFERNMYTDYNINHFATEGVLMNLMWEAAY